MVDLSKEQEDVIMAVYDRLPAAPVAGMPAELATLIEAKNAIAAAENAWKDIKFSPPLDFSRQLEWQNQVQAADDAIIAAQDAYLSTAKTMFESGTLQPAIAAYDQMLADAAAAEQARIAAEAQAAEEARYAPQPVVPDTRKIFTYREDAEATLLYNIRETLPAQSDNEFIKPLIAANAQGDEAYEAAVTALLDAHYESGALETGLRAYQDEVKELGLLPMSLDRQQQQMALIGHYQQRLGEIPLTAAVPPAMSNLVALAREIETMRNAPTGTYTDGQMQETFYNYVQEGFKLYDQRVDVGGFLRERYPSNGENIDTYFASLPEVAWNNPGLLLHSGKDFVINTGTALTAGLFVDLPDALGRMANFGSLKSALGLDPNSVLMDTWNNAVKGVIENNITGSPTIRPGTNDQLVYNGNENVLDIASLFVGSGIVKGGAKYGARLIPTIGETAMGWKDDLVRLFVRAADDVAPVVDDAAARAAREAAEAAARRQADDVAAATARRTDDVAVAPARLLDEEAFRKFTDDVVARLESATGKPGFWASSTSRRTALAIAATPVVAGIGAAITEVSTGGAASSLIVDSSISLMRQAIKIGMIDASNLESSIDTLGLAYKLYTWTDKSAQNSLVQASLSANANPSSPEAIATAKNVALGWLLKPDNLAGLTAQHGIRAQLVDEVYPDKAQADRYLAEQLVKDIIERSEVYALGSNQINENDVKAHIAAVLNGGDSQLAQFLRGSRIENGLRQMWPDIFTAQQPAQESAVDAATDPAATTPGIASRFTAAAERMTNLTSWQRKLTEMAESVKDIQGLGWMSPIIAFAAAIIGLIVAFFKPDAAETVQVQTADGGRKLRDVASALGQGDIVLGNVTSHDGKPQDPIVIDGVTTPVERNRILTPAMGPQ